MSLWKERFKELSEYNKLKRNEGQASQKLINNYKEKNKEDGDYIEFKRTIIYNLEKVFGEGKSKIVIKPNSDSTMLFSKLMVDEEFNRIYDCNVVTDNKNKKLLEISPIIY